MNLLYILIILISLLVRHPFLTREFTLEEAFHVRAAKTVAETGYPLMYYGEQQPQTIYLDRPPGLLLALAASLKVFGVSEFTARLTPLLFFLAQQILLLYFSKRIFRDYFPGVFAAFFLAIHPFSIQNSLQLHFDGSLVSFFVVTYLLAAFHNITRNLNRWRDHTLLAAIFFFALWGKYEPTLLMFLVVNFIAILFKKTFIPKLLIATIISTILFFSAFFAYNLVFNHPEGFWLPFTRTIQLSQGSYLSKILNISHQSLGMWAGSYYIGIRFLSWLSIPTILLASYAVTRFIQAKNLRTDPKLIFLFLWTLSFIATYILVGWAGDYPRYFAPAMPALFLVIGVTVQKSFQNATINSRQLISIFFLTLFLTFLLHLNGFLFIDHITGWIPHLQLPFFVIFFICLALILVFKNHKKYSQFILILLLLFQNFQIIAQYWHDVNFKGSLTNYYGNGPYKPVAEFLRSNLPPDAKILTFDPIGYYWGGQFYDYYQLGYHRVQDIEIITNALLEGKISAIALPSQYLGEYAFKVQKIGFDFNKFLTENFKNHLVMKAEGVEIWY